MSGLRAKLDASSLRGRGIFLAVTFNKTRVFLAEVYVGNLPTQKGCNMSNGYLGLFLDTEGVEDLWEPLTGVKLLPVVHCHHITMKFNPTEEEVEKFPLGVKVSVVVRAYVHDDDNQVLIVLAVPGFNCDNDIPHITVAVSETGKPAKSNELFERKAPTSIYDGLYLPATAGHSKSNGQLRTRR